MSDLVSSVVVLGPSTKILTDLGADAFSTFSELQDHLDRKASTHHISVLVLDLLLIETNSASSWLVKIKTHSPKTQIILITKTHSGEILKSLINTDAIFKILPNFNDPYLERSIQEALAASDLARQAEQLIELFNQQNVKLEKLQKELAERVEKRQRELITSQENLLETTVQTEAWHNAIIAIQNANSIKEIELFLKDSLTSSLHLGWVHISHTASASNSKDGSTFASPLQLDGKTIGVATFGRSAPFTPKDKKFIQQISQAISLVVDRLARQEQAEYVKQQWESTFNAITKPLAIIDHDYNVVRSNQAFLQSSDSDHKKCFELLFSRSSPCEGCQRGSNFELNAKRNYSVSSQKYRSDEINGYINVYTDVTEQKIAENKIIESAKLADLGRVGSSIAHELNNPIAGMLIFTQLLKANLNGTEWFYEDIVEIEKGIFRCRDIIQNLLTSTRQSNESPVNKG